MTNGGDTVSMTGDAEEHPSDSGAVPDASTTMAAREAASDQDYLKFERELAEEARTDTV